jgi:outer membrane protein OmpA-like peptidoglycan-associated protein
MIQMRKFNLAIAFLAGAIIFSGCTLTKMIKLASDQELKVDPNPLELHGGSVPFEMSAILPPKMLPSGKVYTINTIYQYGDQEISVGSIEFNSEDFPNSSSAASRQSVNMSFDYADGMNPGNLFVQGVAKDTRSGKSKTSAKMQVAPGISTTSMFAKPVTFTVYADHGYTDKEELIPTKVNFYFEQGISKLDPKLSYDGNSNDSKTTDLSAFIAEKNVTRTVTITGTHSPEGPERINSNLSEDRAKAIEAFYRKQMKKYDYKGLSDSIKFILKPVIEDWGTLKAALVNYSGISSSDKAQITKVINGNGSFEEKEKELRNFSFYDKLLDEVYPGLRTAKTEILTVRPKMSNAEIAVLAKQIVNGDAPVDTLKLDELMFAATLTPSVSEKIAIYKVAAKSGTWEAHNNLGAALLTQAGMFEGADQKKLVEEALTQLEIASNKNSNALVSTNMAAAYVMQAEYSKSLSAITEGEGASPDNETASKLKGMKGAIQVMNGKYEEAAASFASSADGEVVSFDKGLGELLSGDLDAATTTLSSIKDSEKIGAEANYLLAVVAARQNKVGNVTSRLKDAIAKDPALKEKALNDIEFVKFADAVAKAAK